MSGARRAGLVIGGIVVVAVAAAVVVFGFIGIEQTVKAGTQTTVCGVKVGVNVGDGAVSLLGATDSPLSPGERARIAPLCVVEVVSISDSGLDADADGSSADATLRWRLW